MIVYCEDMPTLTYVFISQQSCKVDETKIHKINGGERVFQIIFGNRTISLLAIDKQIITKPVKTKSDKHPQLPWPNW